MEFFQAMIFLLATLFVVFLIAAIVRLISVCEFDTGTFRTYFGNYQAYRMEYKRLFFSLGGLFISIALLVLSVFIFNRLILFKLDKVLRDYDAGTYKVYVNGSLIPEPSRIINALRSRVSNSRSDHSSGDHEINILILTGKGSMHVNLKRDSKVAYEYWLYCENYELTRNNSIQKFIISGLDKF